MPLPKKRKANRPIIGDAHRHHHHKPSAAHLADHVRAAEDNIERFGVHIAWIFDDHGEAFAYTAGVAAFAHPEFIVFRLGQEMSQWVLNNLAMRVRDGAQRFEAGMKVSGVIEGYDLALIAVEDSSKAKMTVTNRFYRAAGEPPVPALQVAIPDKDGRWPWDEGCAVEQPVLGVVPASWTTVEAVGHDPEAGSKAWSRRRRAQ